MHEVSDEAVKENKAERGAGEREGVILVSTATEAPSEVVTFEQRET